jgi:pantoate--beta-alanine ligase
MGRRVEMQTLTRIDELRRQVRQWRGRGSRVALVPTMGNLHAGHLDLLRRAIERAERTVVSVFVNPLQFGPLEDFAGYPRTLGDDARRLAAAGADVLFAPSVEEVYPAGASEQTRVEVPGISEDLCGASRPGHFAGVATVVCKLFNMVQPDLAVFGEKDYQQLLVIRRMTADLCIPVEIVGAPTVREPDGLAMSSRNRYLTSRERQTAPLLYRMLREAAEDLRSDMTFSAVEKRGRDRLAAAGFRPDYVGVRRSDDLAPPGPKDRELVILTAAYLGRARLIDNLRVNR